MAGDGGRTNWEPFDPNKYKGFWKYYNNDTPLGRAYAAKINLGAIFLVGGLLYWSMKGDKKKT